MNAHRAWLAGGFALIVGLWLTPAMAIDTLQLSIAKWASKALNTRQLDIQLGFNAHGLTVSADAASISLPKLDEPLEHVHLICDRLLLQSGSYQCKKGQISFRQKQLGQQQLNFSLTARPDKAQYHLQLQGVKLAEGMADISARLDRQNWVVSMNSSSLAINTLREVVAKYLDAKTLAQLKGWQTAGGLTVQARIQGKKQQMTKAAIQLSSQQLNISDSAGQWVTEQAQLHTDITLQQQDKNWRWTTKMTVDDGQGYGEPIFIDFKATPVTVAASGKWLSADKQLQLTQATINQQSVLQATASGLFKQRAINRLELTVAPGDAEKIYSTWLQPFMAGNSLAKLKLSGQLAGSLTLRDQRFAVQLQLKQLSVIDEERRFALAGLSGKMGWSGFEQPLITDIHWHNASIYAVPIGAATFKASVQSNKMQMTAPLLLPLLDGSLQVNNFELQRTPAGEVEWSFDGALLPVSMLALSDKLDWPALHGKVSGLIPKVTYAEHQVKVEGALTVKLFDGTTVIRDLRLNSPFGALPQLYANVDISGLDLQLLTQTFDFGEITGKLDGHVAKLRLSDWQPVQFDAEFVTPKNDDSRHRISQQAIDHLSQIGGGAGGVLSRSFLRIFKNFSYKRLGLRCKLRNSVCDMSGIEEAKQGYYIVKGGGGLPPWINVVGYTRRVDWQDLIARLKTVSNSSGPLIQ